MLVSVDDNTFVDKNREYFSDRKSVALFPKANRGPMTKGLRISFAIDPVSEPVHHLYVGIFACDIVRKE